MKTKIIYSVMSRVKGVKGIIENTLMASEFYLIKTMLNDGHDIISLKREKISIEQYNYLFGYSPIDRR